MEPDRAASTPPTSATATETLRVHQANERTMLAWIRTGIALMAFGFAVARFGLFLREIAPVRPGVSPATAAAQTTGSAWLGVALVVVGLAVNAAATMHFRSVRRGIEAGRVGAPSAALVYALGALMALIGGVMVALLVRSITA